MSPTIVGLYHVISKLMQVIDGYCHSYLQNNNPNCTPRDPRGLLHVHLRDGHFHGCTVDVDVVPE